MIHLSNLNLIATYACIIKKTEECIRDESRQLETIECQ